MDGNYYRRYEGGSYILLHAVITRLAPHSQIGQVIKSKQLQCYEENQSKEHCEVDHVGNSPGWSYQTGQCIYIGRVN